MNKRIIRLSLIAIPIAFFVSVIDIFAQGDDPGIEYCGTDREWPMGPNCKNPLTNRCETSNACDGKIEKEGNNKSHCCIPTITGCKQVEGLWVCCTDEQTGWQTWKKVCKEIGTGTHCDGAFEWCN